MKKLTFLLAAAAILSTKQAGAKIWRVNSNVGVNAHFNTLSAAITAAGAGDTIHVEAAATGYGSIIINKRLVLVGTGYFMDDATPNPKTQFITEKSQISGVTFNTGSKGSVISGFTIGSVSINDSLITVQRNNISSNITLAAAGNTDGDTVRQNVLGGFFGNSTNNKCTNLLVYNNIVTTANPFILNASFINNVSGYIINNSFVNTNGATFSCVNFIFQNNIFSSVSFGSYFNSNVYYNNIVSNTSLPANNGNQQNIPMTSVFQGWSSGTGFSSDGRYQLKPGSPAAGAGILNGGAVDCGAFGGPAPYILSGMPPVPSIYNLNVPDQVATGTTSINVSVSAIAH